MKDVPLEALNWRLAAYGATPKISLNFSGIRPSGTRTIKGKRVAHFTGHGKLSCVVYDRYALEPGTKFTGPAIVEERESTVIVGPDGNVTVDTHLNLIVDIHYSGVDSAETNEMES
jgi:N-methylhydantoinase A